MTYITTYGSWVTINSGRWAGYMGRVTATERDGRAHVRLMNSTGVTRDGAPYSSGVCTDVANLTAITFQTAVSDYTI